MALLPFQREILEKLEKENGVVILAKGLGVHELIYQEMKKHALGTGVVFFMGIPPSWQESFQKRLFADGIQKPLNIIKSEVVQKQRKTLYEHGGIFCITARILVVDLLNKVAPLDSITGIILNGAHSVRDSSQEAFALKVYRRFNQTGFLKAFSTNPERFRQFSAIGLTQKMKTLCVAEIELWPRFRESVKTSLAEKRPEVDYRQVKMLPTMAKLQKTIITVMEACLVELKKGARSLDLSRITMENGLFTSFEHQLRKELDPVWGSLKRKTRQLVNDLGTLRKLLGYLVRYDCVTFHRYLLSIRETERQERAIWLLTSAAKQLYTLSQERVYKFQENEAAKQPPPKKKRKLNNPGKIEVVLEKNPKWELLEQVLKDIEELKKENDEQSSGSTLILCLDERTKDQIGKVICTGSKSVLKECWKRFLQSSLTRGASLKKRKRPIANKLRALIKEAERLRLKPGKPQDKEKIELVDFRKLKIGGTWEPVNEDREIIVHSFKDASRVIAENTPSYIVLFDPDLDLIREVEVYQAMNQHLDVRLFLLCFEESAEDQRYRSSIRKERDAFSDMIKQKSSLPHRPEDVAINVEPWPRKIIVDTREFRSALPQMIYADEIEVVPCQLEVGDYILTPEICVERKSIPDLLGSLKSGRLFTQLTQMSRFYKTPVLLIEFSREKQFCLVHKNDLPAEVQLNHVISKLVLVMKHFPQCKLIWSKNPQCSVSIFRSLKLKRKEPDLEKAAVIGTDAAVDEFDLTPQDILRKLPGVNPFNISKIVRSVDDLRELCTKSKDELQELLGSKPSGEKLHKFLHKDRRKQEDS